MSYESSLGCLPWSEWMPGLEPKKDDARKH